MSELTITAVAIPQQNRLLAALPDDVAQRIFPSLRLTRLRGREVLYKSGGLRRHAYFPVDSVVTLVHTLANGSLTQFALVGNDGFVGMTSLIGGIGVDEAKVMCAGFAYELPMQHLKEELNRNSYLVYVLLHYAQELMSQVGQTAVCNRYHSIDQHLCSLLLHVLDRVRGGRLPLTQEWIADMLGVRRVSVTRAAHQLKKVGVLEYGRGQITVLDRAELECRACECYAAVKKSTASPRPGTAWVRPNHFASITFMAAPGRVGALGAPTVQPRSSV